MHNSNSVVDNTASCNNNSFYVSHSSKSVIVFVHGFNTDNYSCWKNVKYSSYWPHLISEDDDFKNISIFLGGYPTSKFKYREFGIGQSSNHLFESLNTRIDGQCVMDKERVIFICYSFGGSVVRRMILEHYEHFKHKMIGLFFVATPSLGSCMANIFAPYSYIVTHKQLLFLRTKSSYSQDLDDWFREFLDSRKIPGLVGFECVEQKNDYFFFRIVGVKSGSRYFGSKKIIPDANHRNIVKPSSKKSHIYVYFKNFLEKNNFFDKSSTPYSSFKAIINQGPSATEYSAQNNEKKFDDGVRLLKAKDFVNSHKIFHILSAYSTNKQLKARALVMEAKIFALIGQEEDSLNAFKNALKISSDSIIISMIKETAQALRSEGGIDEAFENNIISIIS